MHTRNIELSNSLLIGKQKYEHCIVHNTRQIDKVFDLILSGVVLLIVSSLISACFR